MNVDMSKVVPARDMAGDTAEDTALLKAMHVEAAEWLASFEWCGQIDDAYFGLGVGGVVAVFLFRIRPAAPEADDTLWVIVGDLPPAYLVTEVAPNPACALKTYSGLMREWVDAVREQRPTDDLIPANVEATAEWADELDGRLGFIGSAFFRLMPWT